MDTKSTALPGMTQKNNRSVGFITGTGVTEVVLADEAGMSTPR